MKADKPIKNRYKGALREGSENYLYGGEYYMYGGEYANGGEVAKYAGSAAYGALEGVLDTVTFGLTDPLTDIGYDALQKAGNKKLDLSDPEDLKQLEKQNKLRGAGNIGGAIAGGVVTGNVPGAIKTGVEGANVIVQNSDVSDKTRQIANTATNITGTVAGFAGAGVGSAGESALDMGLANLAKDADQLGTFTNIAKGAQVGGQAASLIPNKGGLAQQARAIQAEEARQKEMLAQQQVLLDSQDSLVAAGIMPNTVPMQYYGSGGKLGNKIGKLRREGYPQDQAVAIAYSMQKRNKLEDGGPTMLPTVEVTADKYTGEDINKAYPYYNTLSAEERKLFRDSSPIGAQIRSRARNGQGVNTATMDAAGTALLNQLNPITAFQAPQSLMVEGVEALRGNEYNFANALQADKQRLPSETMGFQTTDDMSWYNPNVVGNFVLDMMADPTNIVGAGLLKSGVKGAAKTAAKTGTNVVEGAINSTDNLVSSIDNVTPKPWQVQELPGLHLKSTMEGGAISKIIEPKTGLINTEQALAIIAKESGGADKVALIKQGLGDNIPKKMDYNEFRKVVQDQLIPLERQFATRNSNYGIDRLGYTNHRTNHKDLMDKYSRWIKEAESEIVSGKFSGSHGFTPNSVQESIDLYKKQSSIIPIENQTIILSNKSKFGKGSSAHNNPEETLGHIHFLRDAETPDVLTVTQIQSDAFQGTHRIMSDKSNLSEKIKELERHLTPEGRKLAEEIGGKEAADLNQKAAKELIEKYKKEAAEASGPNPIQKQLLDKNHQERYLQELVDYAGKRGDVNKVRVPTSETAAKVQGYQKKIVGATEDWAGPMSNKGKIIEDYSPEHQTILKKYSQQPKTIKNLFGKEPTIVTDSKGNTWYEFDIPDKFKKGKGEIKAFTVTPIGIGLGINELQNNALSQPSKKGMGGIMNINSSDYNFYQDGGSMVLARPGEREYDFSSPLAFIKSVAEIRGVPVEDYINMLEKIGVHESTTLNTTTKQVGGGPGKGAYQVESESIPTAKGRVNNIFKNYNNGVVPDWATPIYESEDLLDLNTLLQTALTAADVLYRDNFNIANALESDENLITEWAKGYQTENDPAQMEDFRRDLKAPNYQRLKGTTQARLIELNKEYSDADVLGTQQKAAIDEMNMAAPNMGYVPTALDNTYVSPTMDYSSIVQDAAIPAMHKVEAGQTLSGIANQYNTTVEQLKQANPNIKSIHSIQIGQDINIPFQKAMGGMIDKNVMMQDLYAKGGLFDNMWAKRKRGEAPAKPGDKDYPDAKAWKAAIASTRAMGGEMYAQGGSFDNPGFRALPAEVQAKIKGNAMAYGGNMNAQDMADAIINAPKGTYSSDIIKKARVAKNFAKAYGGNMYAYGGELPYSFEMGGEMLQTIDNGGTHEENPNGGVPATPDGMNLVEEGETVMNGNFVFSNRLKVTPEVAREFSLGKKAIGKSYAEVSKMYQDEERPNDRFNNRAAARQLENLAEAQESYKAVEQQEYDQAGQQMNEAIAQQQMQEQMAQQMDPNNPLTRSGLSQAEALMQQQNMNQQQMVQQMMPQGQEQQMMPPQQMGYGGKMKYQVGGPFDSVGMSLLPGALDEYNVIYNTDYNLGDMPDPSMVTPPLAFEDTQAVDMADLQVTPEDIALLQGPTKSEQEAAAAARAAARKKAMQEAAAKGLSYAPAAAGAAGMIQAMSDQPSYMSPAMTNIDFTPQPLDMTQARANAMSAARMAQRGAAAASRGSVGSLMDAQERIAGATARGLGQTAMQQDLYNRQMQQQAAQQSLAQAQANARLQMYADEFNIASDTAKTDRILEMMMATGQNLGSIGTDILNRQTVEKLPLFFNPDGTFKGTTTT